MRLRNLHNLPRSTSRIVVSPDINTGVSVSNIHNLFIIQKTLVKSIAVDSNCLNTSAFINVATSTIQKACRNAEAVLRSGSQCAKKKISDTVSELSLVLSKSSYKFDKTVSQLTEAYK